MNSNMPKPGGDYDDEWWKQPTIHEVTESQLNWMRVRWFLVGVSVASIVLFFAEAYVP